MGRPDDNSASSTSGSDEQLYYFAYGPLVNDMVRQRRGISVETIQPAFLPEYRLTFAIGGLANIVPRRGYDVHGLLMKLASQKDWDQIIKFDAGSTPSWHSVVPYDQAGNEGDPVKAKFVEFSGEVEDEFLDTPIEVLPQSRYLELIAGGMRTHGVDEDYLQDQILAIPFTPKRTPGDYEQIPRDPKLLATSRLSFLKGSKNAATSDNDNPSLPRISFQKYLKLCQKQPLVGGDLFFIMDDTVYRIEKADPDKIPPVKWIKANGHGKPDMSLLVHQLVVDPDIPLCDELNQMTALHFAWAENHVHDILIEKYQCLVTKVALLKVLSDKSDGEKDEDGQEQAKSTSSSLFLKTARRTSKRLFPVKEKKKA